MVPLVIRGVVRTTLAVPSTVVFLCMVFFSLFALKFVPRILFFNMEQIPPRDFPLRWTASLLRFSSGELISSVMPLYSHFYSFFCNLLMNSFVALSF